MDFYHQSKVRQAWEVGLETPVLRGRVVQRILGPGAYQTFVRAVEIARETHFDDQTAQSVQMVERFVP